MVLAPQIVIVDYPGTPRLAIVVICPECKTEISRRDVDASVYDAGTPGQLREGSTQEIARLALTDIDAWRQHLAEKHYS